MNFKITHFIFVFSFLSILSLNTSFALDLYVQDSYVSSRVKYTLSNDNNLNNLKILLKDPYEKDFVISEFSTLNLSQSSFESFIPHIYFNKAGKYTLSAISGDKILASDEFLISIFNPYNLSAIGGDDNKLNLSNNFSNSNVFSLNDQTDSTEENQDEFLLGIENPRFEIFDFDESILVDEFLTFSVQALDADQNPDTEYLGSIEFEVIDDDNVVLPDIYEFKADDAGLHAFSSSISFSTPGTKVIRVFDTENDSLQAAFELEVLPSAQESDEDANSSVSITLESPVSGLSNVNTIEFLGNTLPGKEVKIYENDALLISLGTDSDGDFQFVSPPFSDGLYEFYAEIEGVKSNIVELEIKTQAAILNDFVISPESVRPLKKFNLELTFSDRVSAASVVIDGKKFDLESVDNTSLKYFSELSSPVLAGDYNISVVYTDFQGASNTFLIPKKLLVLEPDTSDIVDQTEVDFVSNPIDSLNNLDGVNTNNQNNNFVTDEVFIPPTVVDGVTIIPDTNKVQLNWLPSSDNTGVAFYIIRFGFDPSDLSSQIRTFDSNTAFTIEQLNENKQYYFSIYAVDLDGNLSPQGSNLVSAVTSRSITSTFGLNVDGVLVQPDTSNSLDPNLINASSVDANQNLDGLETSNVGPSENIVIVSFVLSIFLGLYVRRKKFFLF